MNYIFSTNDKLDLFGLKPNGSEEAIYNHKN